MKNVPLLKEIVDYYSGPDRVTAKKQQEELERVAKTIPASAPSSVKQFTDRAVLSLQVSVYPGYLPISLSVDVLKISLLLLFLIVNAEVTIVVQVTIFVLNFQEIAFEVCCVGRYN